MLGSLPRAAEVWAGTNGSTPATAPIE